jgi:broad specificity phosphatase PhoE
MYLYLLRHGQSLNNANFDQQRHHDPDLTELGERQAVAFADWFVQAQDTETMVHLQRQDPRRELRHPYTISELYCSPMRRAMQTARPLAKGLGLKPIVWPDIHETGGLFMHSPEGTVGYPGMTRSAILAEFLDYQPQERISEDGWYTHPGEEPRDIAGQRVLGVADHLKQRALDSTSKETAIMLVAHGDFIAILIRLLMGTAFDYPSYIWINNCGLTRLDLWTNGTSVMRYVNRISHLDPADVT